MRSYFDLVDYNTLGLKGMRCRDITPIFADPEAFSELVDDLTQGISADDFDTVVGIEALGFILATAIAVRMGKGLVPIRKAGKLPVESDAVTLPEVRGQVRTLELRANALTPMNRVLLVDDWVKSGTQIAGALELIEGQGARVVGIAALNFDENELTRPLMAQYRVHTLFYGGKPLVESR